MTHWCVAIFSLKKAGVRIRVWSKGGTHDRHGIQSVTVNICYCFCPTAIPFLILPWCPFVACPCSTPGVRGGQLSLPLLLIATSQPHVLSLAHRALVCLGILNLWERVGGNGKRLFISAAMSVAAWARLLQCPLFSSSSSSLGFGQPSWVFRICPQAECPYLITEWTYSLNPCNNITFIIV